MCIDFATQRGPIHFNRILMLLRWLYHVGAAFLCNIIEIVIFAFVCKANAKCIYRDFWAYSIEFGLLHYVDVAKSLPSLSECIIQTSNSWITQHIWQIRCDAMLCHETARITSRNNSKTTTKRYKYR